MGAWKPKRLHHCPRVLVWRGRTHHFSPSAPRDSGTQTGISSSYSLQLHMRSTTTFPLTQAEEHLHSSARCQRSVLLLSPDRLTFHEALKGHWEGIMASAREKHFPVWLIDPKLHYLALSQRIERSQQQRGQASWPAHLPSLWPLLLAVKWSIKASVSSAVEKGKWKIVVPTPLAHQFSLSVSIHRHPGGSRMSKHLHWGRRPPSPWILRSSWQHELDAKIIIWGSLKTCPCCFLLSLINSTVFLEEEAWGTDSMINVFM